LGQKVISRSKVTYFDASPPEILCFIAVPVLGGGHVGLPVGVVDAEVVLSQAVAGQPLGVAGHGQRGIGVQRC